MTEGAVRVVVHRLRKRYRQVLRDEIAQNRGRSREVAEEMRTLFDSVRRPGHVHPATAFPGPDLTTSQEPL